ncbi:MAG TPA: hypothetical protein VLB83_01500 [Candidatus Paceibacterota bacterium]|nr:hypothetical protein [Candidatus Paceibacterota bacterium]
MKESAPENEIRDDAFDPDAQIKSSYQAGLERRGMWDEAAVAQFVEPTGSGRKQDKATPSFGDFVDSEREIRSTYDLIEEKQKAQGDPLLFERKRAELVKEIEEEIGDEELADRVRMDPSAALRELEGMNLGGASSAEIYDTAKRLLEKYGTIPPGEEARTLTRSVIGAKDEKEAVKILAEQMERFAEPRWPSENSDHWLRMFNARESLTESNRALVGMANVEIDSLRARFGLEPFDISEDHVQMFRDGAWMFHKKDSLGQHHSQSQVSAIDSTATREQPYRIEGTILHEMIHAKAYSSIRVVGRESTGQPIVAHRTGVSFVGSDGKIYLRPLNEAITEEITRRTMVKAKKSDHPALLHAKIAMESRLGKKITKKFQNDDEASSYVKEKDGTIWPTVFAYPKERRMLGSLLEAVSEHVPKGDDGKPVLDREALFDKLLAGYFTGNLLPFGRAMNTAFGRGTFREFGRLNTVEEQMKFIKKLKKDKSVLRRPIRTILHRWDGWFGKK